MLSFRKHLIISLILCAVGLVGLFVVFSKTLPTWGPRWLFFFFLLISLSGLVLPLIAFLNMRFQGERPVENRVVIREAILFGILGDLLAWLHMGRELTLPIALIITVGFILIEFLLRLSERSRWKPTIPNNE